MKRFIVFVKKEMLHIFRDQRTVMILIAMPLVQILIFGYVISSEIKNASIGILDKSKDELTQQATQKLLSSGYFYLEKYLTSEQEFESAFNKDRVKMVVVFEPEFAKRFDKEKAANIQLITDASDANTAQILSNYATGILQGFQAEQNAKIGISKAFIKTDVRMFYNQNLDGVYMSVPGIMTMILMIVSAMMTSISITREKEFGSMEVLLLSPLKPVQIILGKVTPYIILAAINSLSILAMGYWVFKVPMNGSLILLLFEAILFTILALSLGIFISTIAKNQMVAMFISMFALMLPTILLSGFIFPIENMPLPLRIVTNLIPPKWFIIIVKKIMLKGLGFAYVWKETLILLGFIVLFVGLSIKKFKVRLE